jgi:protein phosphatase
MTLVLNYAARSDRGLVRSNNQDSAYAGQYLLAVADGMGGYAGGEVASKVVIAALALLDESEPGEDLLDQLRDATRAGNGAIADLVDIDPELDGMGTTLSAVLFTGSRIGLVHIGDSRVYLLRGGTFSQITHDDSFVQSLVDEGRITQDEAAVHPQRSLLIKALTGYEVEPKLTIREARAGDRYLLCSDGLSGVVAPEMLSEVIRTPDRQACADRLIELALEGGGPDNVTVIVADVVEKPDEPPQQHTGNGTRPGTMRPVDADGPQTGPISIIRDHQLQQAQHPHDQQRKSGRGKVVLILVLVLLLLIVGGAAAAWYFLLGGNA